MEWKNKCLMKLIKSILLLASLLLLYGCGEFKLEEESETSENNQEEANYTVQLNVQSRNNAKVNYPLSLFLFDEGNNCVSKETIPDESTNYSSSLPKGKYTLVVLSGLNNDDYSYPLEIIPDSYISLNQDNLSGTPLQMGKANVNLTQSTRITVILSYAVASLNFTLKGIPQEATATEVKVSPVSSGVSFNGAYKNDEQKCIVNCQKNGTEWQSNTVYVFPSESTKTHLSINIQTPDGNEAYGYTYEATLKAGYPYHFTGNYQGGISLDGEFQAEGWQDEIDCEFGFDEILPDEGNDNSSNDDNEDQEEPSEDEDEDTFVVSEIPGADAVWGYFYVWKVSSISAYESEAVIIAPEQFYTLKADATKLISEYEEDGIGGWRMFTREEAESFRDQFSGEIKELNDFIKEYGLKEFKYSDGRYLCNNGSSTFSFTNDMILNAGRTVKYYLRPIKTVRFKQK